MDQFRSAGVQGKLAGDGTIRRPAQRRRKFSSDVWVNSSSPFEYIFDDITGEEKAMCINCGLCMSAKSKNGTSHLRRHLETDGCKKKRQQGPISPAADSAAGPSPAGDGDQQQEAVDEDDDDAFVASICACYDKLLADDLVDVVKRNDVQQMPPVPSLTMTRFFGKRRERVAARSSSSQDEKSVDMDVVSSGYYEV
uniref:BED-type domain-containing protein n=2 Tax=Oryza TaxID=4527 RepID=A0A0E0PIC9_ORYRU